MTVSCVYLFILIIDIVTTTMVLSCSDQVRKILYPSSSGIHTNFATGTVTTRYHDNIFQLDRAGKANKFYIKSSDTYEISYSV